VILDRDSKFDATVITFLKATSATEAEEHPIALAQWNRGTLVGSCRREILDHVIALDERHLLRLMRDYVNYHHEDRIHDSLAKTRPTADPPKRSRPRKQL
jgi:hypothetical protein